jgi:hypothetical protein
MTTRSWIRRLFARTPRTTRKEPARFRPRLETLEDRLAPAVHDVTSGGTFTTIQLAINAANPGDTILVDAGTYNESVTVNKSVTLLGANAGVNPNTGTRGAETIVEPGPNSSFDTSSVILVTASNVTIDGFTVQGSIASPPAGQSAAFTLTSGTTVYAAVGISNSSNYNTGGSSPSTTDVSGLTVQNNVVKDFTQVGVYGDTSDGRPSTGNTIANNFITDVPNNGQGGYVGEGVIIYDNFYADVTGNKITNVRTGIQTGNNFLPAGTFSPSISSNNVSATVKGVDFNLQYQSASPFTISDNTITQYNGSVSPAYNVGLLIQSIQGSVQALIQGNNVSGFLYGVEFGGNNANSTVTLQGGTLSSNTYGVWDPNNDYFYPAPYNTTAALSSVTITNSITAGIWVDSTSANSNGQFDTTDSVSLAISGGTVTGGKIGLQATGAKSAATMTGGMISGASTGALIAASATGKIVNATITGNRIGVDVFGATAFLQGDNLSSNTSPGTDGISDAAGLRARNNGAIGAIVDAGQVGGGTDFTYLDGGGAGNGSTGGNIFTGYSNYSGSALPTVPQAILDLNGNSPNNRPGPEGGPYDLMAQKDNFGVNVVNGNYVPVELLVYHDTDNSALGFVNYTSPVVPTVQNWGDATTNLLNQVNSASLGPSIKSSLDSKLQAAIADFASGDSSDAVSQLQAFVTLVASLQRDKEGYRLAGALGNGFIASANQIITAVG